MTLQLTAQVIIPCNWKLFTYSLHCLWNILKVISYTLVSFILDYCLEVLFYELFTLRLRHILIWYFGSFLPDIFTQSKIYEIIYTESTSTQRLQKNSRPYSAYFNIKLTKFADVIFTWTSWESDINLVYNKILYFFYRLLCLYYLVESRWCNIA